MPDCWMEKLPAISSAFSASSGTNPVATAAQPETTTSSAGMTDRKTNSPPRSSTRPVTSSWYRMDAPPTAALRSPKSAASSPSPSLVAARTRNT
jgi:hypothetical protein